MYRMKRVTYRFRSSRDFYVCIPFFRAYYCSDDSKIIIRPGFTAANRFVIPMKFIKLLARVFLFRTGGVSNARNEILFLTTCIYYVNRDWDRRSQLEPIVVVVVFAIFSENRPVRAVVAGVAGDNFVFVFDFISALSLTRESTTRPRVRMSGVRAILN